MFSRSLKARDVQYLETRQDASIEQRFMSVVELMNGYEGFVCVYHEDSEGKRHSQMGQVGSVEEGQRVELNYKNGPLNVRVAVNEDNFKTLRVNSLNRQEQLPSDLVAKIEEQVPPPAWWK